MAIVLGDIRLSTDDLVQIARFNEPVTLQADALARIRKCREMLEEKIQSREIMYGVNTGIGEFSEVVLDDDQIQDFQKYLIYNHAAGIGDPVPIDMFEEHWLAGLMFMQKGIQGVVWK